MAGLGKRDAEYVPYAQRMELDKLSKADLMEIAYSFAVRITGSDDFHEAYNIVKAEHEALAQNGSRKPVKLTADVAPNSREEVAAIMIAAGTAPWWMIRDQAKV